MIKAYAQLYCAYCNHEHKIEITVDGDKITVRDVASHAVIVDYPPGDVPNWNHYDRPEDPR